jgi:hypothetical protein
LQTCVAWNIKATYSGTQLVGNCNIATIDYCLCVSLKIKVKGGAAMQFKPIMQQFAPFNTGAKCFLGGNITLV